MSELIWQYGTDDYYIVTRCGRYTVSKTHPGPIYLAWHYAGKRPDVPSDPIGVFMDSREARRACERHSEQQEATE